jgi:hypothetical protein
VQQRTEGVAGVQHRAEGFVGVQQGGGACLVGAGRRGGGAERIGGRGTRDHRSSLASLPPAWPAVVGRAPPALLGFSRPRLLSRVSSPASLFGQVEDSPVARSLTASF